MNPEDENCDWELREVPVGVSCWVQKWGTYKKLENDGKNPGFTPMMCEFDDSRGIEYLRETLKCRPYGL